MSASHIFSHLCDLHFVDSQMLKLLVLMLLTEQGLFTAGIETPEGLKSKTFANSAQGVEEFSEFVQPLMTARGGTYRICFVPVGKQDYGTIWETLETEKIAYVMVSQSSLARHVAEAGVAEPTIAAVANGCVAALRIYGQKNF